VTATDERSAKFTTEGSFDRLRWGLLPL